jgi:hypothetical protein
MEYPALAVITALRQETINFFQAKQAFHNGFGPDDITLVSEEKASYPEGVRRYIQIFLSPSTLYCPLYPRARWMTINDTVTGKTSNDGRGFTDIASVQFFQSSSTPCLNGVEGRFEPGGLTSKLQHYFKDCKHESEDEALRNRWNVINTRQTNGTRSEFETQFSHATKALAQEIVPALMTIARDRQQNWFDSMQELQKGHMRRITVMQYAGSDPHACAKIILEGLRISLTSFLTAEIKKEMDALKGANVPVLARALNLTMDRLCNVIELLEQKPI